MLCSDLNGKEIQNRGDIYIYIYRWFTLLYSRKKHSIVKQISSNKNEEKKWATDAYDTPDKPYSNYEEEIKQKKNRSCMVLLKHDFRKWKLIYNGKTDQWLPGNGTGRGKRDWLQRGIRKLSGVMGIFIILIIKIVFMGMCVCVCVYIYLYIMYAKSYQTAHLYKVYCMSIIPQ